MYIFKTNDDRTYISSSKENVHRNMEEIGELFPFEEIMYKKTTLAFKGNGTSLSVKPTFFKGTCPLE